MNIITSFEQIGLLRGTGLRNQVVNWHSGIVHILPFFRSLEPFIAFSFLLHCAFVFDRNPI